jgi:spore maturation protein CgeB
MGCGGFLLSSFRTELYEEFTDGVDTAMYYGLEDALEKADFYMTHDDIRLSIARKGYEKVKKYYTYEDRLNRMISLVRTVHG